MHPSTFCAYVYSAYLSRSEKSGVNTPQAESDVINLDRSIALLVGTACVIKYMLNMYLE